MCSTVSLFAAVQSSFYTCVCVCVCTDVCASFPPRAYTSRERQVWGKQEKCIKRDCTQNIRYAQCSPSVRQPDAAEHEEQLNLARRETEKSPGPVRDNLKAIPADYFSSLKAISHPLNLLINARPMPLRSSIGLCLWALAHSHQPRGLSEVCPWPPASSSMTIQLGFEASPEAAQTKINVGTVRGRWDYQMRWEKIQMTEKSIKMVRLFILVRAKMAETQQIEHYQFSE